MAHKENSDKYWDRVCDIVCEEMPEVTFDKYCSEIDAMVTMAHEQDIDASTVAESILNKFLY